MSEASAEVVEAGPDPQQRKAAARQERQAAKAAVRQQRAAEAEAKQEAKQRAREERKQSREQAAKTAKRPVEDDHIVEPPREPKLDWADRRRRGKQERAQAKQDRRIAAGEQGASSQPSTGGGKRFGLLLASLLGAVGLICSVILALGALLVAVGATDGNSAYDLISSMCDALVGPLRDLFSFSGTNAEMKESLVAWGAGSIGYLLIGIFVQSFLRARFEDD